MRGFHATVGVEGERGGGAEGVDGSDEASASVAHEGGAGAAGVGDGDDADREVQFHGSPFLCGSLNPA